MAAALGGGADHPPLALREPGPPGQSEEATGGPSPTLERCACSQEGAQDFGHMGPSTQRGHCCPPRPSTLGPKPQGAGMPCVHRHFSHGQSPEEAPAMAGVSPRPQGHEGLATAPATQARSVCQVSLTGAPRSGSCEQELREHGGDSPARRGRWRASPVAGQGGCQPPFLSPRSGGADRLTRAPEPPRPRPPRSQGRLHFHVPPPGSTAPPARDR